MFFLISLYKNVCDETVFSNEVKTMSEYIFKLKKGEIEIELRSDDPKFIEEQLDIWRSIFLSEEKS